MQRTARAWFIRIFSPFTEKDRRRRRVRIHKTGVVITSSIGFVFLFEQKKKELEKKTASGTVSTKKKEEIGSQKE